MVTVAWFWGRHGRGLIRLLVFQPSPQDYTPTFGRRGKKDEDMGLDKKGEGGITLDGGMVGTSMATWKRDMRPCATHTSRPAISHIDRFWLLFIWLFLASPLF